MDIEKIAIQIKNIFWLAQTKAITVDECYILFNRMRKGMKFKNMDRKEFESTFNKAKKLKKE